MVEKCPEECKVKLDNISATIAELKETDKAQWEVFDQKIHTVEGEVFDRVKTKTLIAVFGVIVTIFLAIMAMTFNTLYSGQKEAVLELRSIDKRMVRVATQLEGHTEGHNDKESSDR